MKNLRDCYDIDKILHYAVGLVIGAIQGGKVTVKTLGGYSSACQFAVVITIEDPDHETIQVATSLDAWKAALKQTIG